MENKLNPKLMILIGVVFVSFSSILTRLSSAPSSIIATYRLGFASLILLPLIIRGHRDELKRINGKTLLLCTLSGMFLAVHFATWLESLNYTSIASSTVLVNTHPIFIVFGSIFILKEKVSPKALLSVGVALTGSLIISLGDSSLGGGAVYGNVLAIIGGFSVACYMMIGRVARQNLSVNAYTFIVYSSCTVTLLIYDLLIKAPLYPYPTNEWLIFLAMAVLCTLLGHSIFNWAIEYVSPTYLSTAILGEPAFATLWGIMLFREIPTVWQVIGGITILAGIYLFNQTTAVETINEAETL